MYTSTYFNAILRNFFHFLKAITTSQLCFILQSCKIKYKKKCRPNYEYGEECHNFPYNVSPAFQQPIRLFSVNQLRQSARSPTVTWPNKNDVNKLLCLFLQDCIIRQKCRTKYEKTCEKIPQEKCRDVKQCVKKPVERCWNRYMDKCKDVRW